MQVLQAPARAKPRLLSVGECFAQHSRGSGARILAGDPHTEPGLQRVPRARGPRIILGCFSSGVSS